MNSLGALRAASEGRAGVDASHAFGRAHVRALAATFDPLAASALSDAAATSRVR